MLIDCLGQQPHQNKHSPALIFFFSQPNTIPCSPLINRGTHRTKDNSVALLAASLRSALGPNCLISTSGAHSDLRFSIQVTSACPHPPASLSRSHSKTPPIAANPKTKFRPVSPKALSAFRVGPAANRDRGAYKAALPFLFFPPLI